MMREFLAIMWLVAALAFAYAMGYARGHEQKAIDELERLYLL